jgi:hypothetical protein
MQRPERLCGEDVKPGCDKDGTIWLLLSPMPRPEVALSSGVRAIRKDDLVEISKKTCRTYISGAQHTSCRVTRYNGPFWINAQISHQIIVARQCLAELAWESNFWSDIILQGEYRDACTRLEGFYALPNSQHERDVMGNSPGNISATVKIIDHDIGIYGILDRFNIALDHPIASECLLDDLLI